MKEYRLNKKTDKKLLSHLITDDMTGSMLGDQDTVVICKKCEAIMNKTTWESNGNSCGVCGGTELKDITKKYLMRYKNAPRQTKSRKKATVPQNNTAPKKRSFNFKKVCFASLIAIIVICAVGFTANACIKNAKIKDWTEIPIISNLRDLEQISKEKLPVDKEPTYPPYDGKEITIDKPFVGEAIHIDEPESQTFSGFISETEIINEYHFAPPRDGIYQFDIQDLAMYASTRLIIYNSVGSRVRSTYFNTESFELNGGEDYKIVIRQDEGESNFNLVISIQKPTADISNADKTYDRITFKYEVNKYLFKPEISGRYRFDIAEAKEDFKLNFSMYDDNGYEVFNEDYKGFSADLEAGRAYELQIKQSSGFSNYCLKIGFQKPSTDITGISKICDAITFEDQINNYTFTPSKSRDYTFALEAANQSSTFRLVICDEYGNSIISTLQSATVSLKCGKEYTVQIQQITDVSSYNLIIK